MAGERGDLALMMSGGGALAAYQVGCLSHMAQRHPDLAVPILTGVSAGALNAAVLAARSGTFAQRVGDLAAAWRELSVDQVFTVAAGSLLWRAARWWLRLASGGTWPGPRPRSFLDTAPLREFLSRAALAEDGALPGIERNLRDGVVGAVAITASSYRTGQAVTWIAGRSAARWEEAHRCTVCEPITVDHIMASAAVPLLFPAIRVGDAWYGDGALLLTTPLSPAVHLGASRVLAITTRHPTSPREDGEAYPSPAHVAGSLLNALFLDQIDTDALRVQRINELIARLPDPHPHLRRVEVLILRPSRDLGALASDFEPRLPRALRFLTRGLGTREARNRDLLGMLMFQPDYIECLLRQGWADAEARRAEIDAFLASDRASITVNPRPAAR